MKNAAGIVASIVVLGAATGCAERAEGPAEEEATRAIATPVQGGALQKANDGVVAIVSLFPEGYRPFCSGVVLTRWTVLTARHCISDFEYERYEAGADAADAGPPDLTKPWECTKEFKGDKPFAEGAMVSTDADGYRGKSLFRIAKTYFPGSNNLCDGDIAVLQLADPIPEDVPLHAPRLAAAPAVGDAFAMAGYGSVCADVLHCSDEFGLRRRKEGGAVTCVGCGAPAVWASDTATICPGDSGGPALAPNGDVIGVANSGHFRGLSCVAGHYQRLDIHAGWIRAAVRETSSTRGDATPVWADDGVAPGADGGAITDAAVDPNAPSGAAAQDPAAGGSCEAAAAPTGGGWMIAAASLALTGALVRRRSGRRSARARA